MNTYLLSTGYKEDKFSLHHTFTYPSLFTPTILYVALNIFTLKPDPKMYLYPFNIAAIKYKFSGKGISVRSESLKGILYVKILI
jgi:hypothetical protein